MQELQIKAQEQQRKAAKDQADNALKQQQLQIDRDRIAAQQATEAKRTQLDAMKAAAQIYHTETQNKRAVNIDALKFVADLESEKELRAMQERLRARQERSKA